MKLKKLLALLLTVVLLVASSVVALPVNAGEGDAKWGDTGYYESLTYNSTYGYSGGAGTKESPYEIATAEDLAQLAANCNKWTSEDTTNKYGYSNAKYFKLTADIDLKNVAWPGIGAWGGGSANYWFKGNFDGNGYVIKNLKIEESATAQSSYGFFGGALNATISNVGIISGSVNVTSTAATYLGSLVGVAKSNLTVNNCYSFIDMTYSSSAAVVHSVGGLVGFYLQQDNIVFTNCLYAGDITVSAVGDTKPTIRVGGILGTLNSPTTTDFTMTLTMSNCTASTNIVSDAVNYASGGNWDSALGLLVGAMISNKDDTASATINDCYATGTIAAINARGDSFRMGVIGVVYGGVAVNRQGNASDGYTFTSTGNFAKYTRTKQQATDATPVTKSSLIIGQSTNTNYANGSLGFTSNTAKNVDISALNLLKGVGAQKRTVTVDENDYFGVRFVGELLVEDYSNFASVGVMVTIKYGDTTVTDYKLSSKSLYKSLNPEITPEKGYLIAGGIYDVPNGAEDTVTFTFKPYVELADGTVCYGATSQEYTFTAGEQVIAQS